MREGRPLGLTLAAVAGDFDGRTCQDGSWSACVPPNSSRVDTGDVVGTGDVGDAAPRGASGLQRPRSLGHNSLGRGRRRAA